MTEPGILDVHGVSVFYMKPASLLVTRELEFIDNNGILKTMGRIFKDASGWDPINLLLTGPKGQGKSLCFAYYAKREGIPYLAIDCSEETRERHLKGGFVVKNGDTPYVLGAVANAIQVANECGRAILVLEEINALTPERQKELNSVTDFRKKLELPELSWKLELREGAKLFVAGTLNPSVYGGTYDMNEDLKSRFLEIDVPYPRPEDEAQILLHFYPNVDSDFVRWSIAIAEESRQSTTQYSLSTRDLLDIIKVYLRSDARLALKMLAAKFSPEDRKFITSRIHDITEIDVAPKAVDAG